MANAPVSGEYPKDHQTPALTQPFAKEVNGFPVTVANLADPKHPINIRNISGKGRGATILLSDDTVYWATGHLASDPWLPLGSGGGSGGGTVKTVNGVGPDEDGNVELPVKNPGQLKVKAITGGTYTATAADADTMLVFNTPTKAELNLPALAFVPDPAVVIVAVNVGAGGILCKASQLIGGPDLGSLVSGSCMLLPDGWFINGGV